MEAGAGRRLRRRYMPPAESRYWFPERETMDPATARRRSSSGCRSSVPTPTRRRPSTAASGTRRAFHPSQLKPRGLRDAGAGRHQGGAARARRRPALRRLPLHPGERGPPHPRHERHDRAADRLRHRARGLALDRERPCADHVGHGPAARPTPSASRRSSRSTCRQLGRARRRRAAARQGVPLRRRRDRHERALRAVAGPAEADRLLRHADLRAPPRPTAKDEGLDPRELGLRVLFFSGEPGASIPASGAHRGALRRAGVDSGSMGEVTPWMNVAGSAETPGHALLAGRRLHRGLRPRHLPARALRQRGTPVYTQLERTSQPMIRLVSGDLTLWEAGPTPCGRTYPWLPHGIIGRIDDMFTIRGENVYPSEIDAVAEPDARLRRRAPHRHQPRRHDGRALHPHRGRRRGLADAARREAWRPTWPGGCTSCSASGRSSRWPSPARSSAPTSRRGG
jgi:hypothetical protein